jgi:hypothetical protein
MEGNMQIYLLFTSYDSAVNYPTIQYPFNNLSLSTNASTRLKIKPEGRQLYTTKHSMEDGDGFVIWLRMSLKR